MFTEPRSTTGAARRGPAVKTIAMPDREICSELDLYFRRFGPVRYLWETRRFALDRGGSVSCDTFFNLLSAVKLLEHTIVEEVGLMLRLRGRFQLSVYGHRLTGGTAELLSQHIVEELSADEWVDSFPTPLHVRSACDVLYFTLEALEDDCEFFAGRYYASEVSQAPHDIKALYATTVFRRPEKFRRNEQRLLRYFDKCPDLREAFDFLAVDNGRALEEGPLFRVVPNDNLGSSGGCARAMLEAMESEAQYTHLLYADDDIVVDPTVLENILLLLRILRPGNQRIAVAMLRAEYPTVLHEMGARRDYGFTTILKQDLQVSDFTELLRVEVEEEVDYSAWWLACFPVSQLRAQGLPLPLFIRGDDVEYGCREKASYLATCGFAVWHESFEYKFTDAADWYFRARNDLAIAALDDRMPVLKQFAFLKYHFARMLWAMMTYRYKHVSLALAGVYDFMRGPDYVFRQNVSQRLSSLAEFVYPVRHVSLEKELFSQVRADLPFKGPLQVQETFARKCLRLATLCGHLLPPCLCRGMLLLPPWAGPVMFLRSQGAVFYNPSAGTGYEVRKSSRRALVLLVAMALCAARLALVWCRLRRDYLASWRLYTTPEFWRQQFENVSSARVPPGAAPDANEKQGSASGQFVPMSPAPAPHKGDS